MRRVVLAVLCAVVAGMMTVPASASAGTVSIVVKDMRGDLGPKFDWSTCEVLVTWPEQTSLTKVGYFDMLWFSLSEKSKTYTFKMEVSSALPIPGSKLPTGFKEVKWLMWIDPEPWNMKYNPISSLFAIELVYNGISYSAELLDYSTGELIASLPFAVSGATLQIQFSAASIGNLDSFWFMPCTVVVWAVTGAGYWDLDSTDPGAVPGQVWWDIPWPPQ